jgi:hypothetical protein
METPFWPRFSKTSDTLALRLKRGRLEVHGHVEGPVVPFRGGG